MDGIYIVVDGQYGSCGKGAVAAHFHRDWADANQRSVAIRVAGPNAGHTVIDDNGTAWPFRHLPVATVVDPHARLVLAPGSEIDFDVLLSEIMDVEKAGYSVRERLFIHEQATVLLPEHRDAEGGNDGPLQQRIGSTGKGVGAARAERIMRRAPIVRDWAATFQTLGNVFAGPVDDIVPARALVLVEGTQGYGLGLHAGHYPYCTSSDCRAIDFLAMSGIDDWMGRMVQPVVVLRTYPIRVAGNSGPMLDELTWDELALRTDGYIKPERTTVTKKIRRVGEWDASLARRALRANGGENALLVISFLDYIDPSLASVTDRKILDESGPANDWLWAREKELDHRIDMVTTGPNTAIWL